ncbi:putative secreted protein [Candidatus Phytoplasma asteris]|uniref:Secreted protein n=1 Tax=Candidatus Phytoplasma asteris TaxID=85620 RepID=A0ABZ3CD07_9MOLU
MLFYLLCILFLLVLGNKKDLILRSCICLFSFGGKKDL